MKVNYRENPPTEILTYECSLDDVLLTKITLENKRISVNHW